MEILILPPGTGSGRVPLLDRRENSATGHHRNPELSMPQMPVRRPFVERNLNLELLISPAAIFSASVRAEPPAFLGQIGATPRIGCKDLLGPGFPDLPRPVTNTSLGLGTSAMPLGKARRR